MMNFFKRFFAVVLIFLIAVGFSTPSFAAQEDMLELGFLLDNDLMSTNINGDFIKVQSPYLDQNTVMVPLEEVLSSFGAELNPKENDKINIIYRNAEIEITLNQVKYIANQVEKSMPVAPVRVNNSIMVPLQFFSDNLGAVTKYDSASKKISIIIEDDGALSDLSFLTGGISKGKVGNSYFNWSMNIPKNSRILNVSFSSKYIAIENENRQISIEVDVAQNKEHKSLKDFYKEVEEEDDSYYDEFSMNEKARLPYIQYLYFDKYYGATLERMYVTRDYTYSVYLTSYDAVNSEKLKEDQYYNSIMNSFSLGFKGNAKDIEDLSKIKFGFSKYENFATFDDSKYFTWEMNMIPEWDDISFSVNESPLNTRLGIDSKEYINVSIDKVSDIKSAEAYAIKNKNTYDTNFNPKYYKFVQKKAVDIGEYKGYRLVFNVEMGGKKYVIDESYILADSLVYEISIKCPQEKYDSEIKKYYQMLDTFKISKDKAQAFKEDIDNYNSIHSKTRVGKDESPAEIKNKAYGYSLKIPGYWTKADLNTDELQMFINTNANSLVAMETIDNNIQNKSAKDEEKFEFLKSLIDKYKMKFKGKESLKDKGTNIRVLSYRLDSDDDEIYSDVKCYILDKGKYSYCFLTLLPDLSSTEKNIIEIQNIWNSIKFGV